MKQFKGFDGENQLVLAVLTAVLVVIFTLVYAFLRLRKSGRRAILITGICDSGKTVIFTRLAYDKFVNTHTSVKENLAHYPPGKRTLQLIDVPGHERVRNRYLEEYKSSCRALVYVIDSNSFQKDIRDIAEYLYILLTDKAIVRNCGKILILCNKQDVPMAKDSKVIRTLLEKELNTLRETKANQLSSTDESSSDHRLPLGNPSQEFNFSQFSHAQIDFAESYAVEKEDSGPNLDYLKNWLRTVST